MMDSTDNEGPPILRVSCAAKLPITLDAKCGTPKCSHKGFDISILADVFTSSTDDWEIMPVLITDATVIQHLFRMTNLSQKTAEELNDLCFSPVRSHVTIEDGFITAAT